MSGIKHPARRYVYYLLSKRLYDVKTVISMMGEVGIAIPTDEFELTELTMSILRCRAEMVYPKGFNPRAKPLDQETEAWLREWKIFDIWQGSKYVTTARELLQEPPVRHLLELLLLSPLTASAIAHRVAQRFDLSPRYMNAAVVRAFAHYFWDQNALDPAQWGAFVTNYCQNSVAYLAAISAPRTSAGAAFVIAVADKDPQALSAAERYEAASSMAFSMMMHHALPDRPSTGSTYAAFTALNMMRMADDELSKHRGASTDLIDELRRIGTVYDQKPPLQITQATYIQRPVIDVKSEAKDANDD